MASPGIPRVVFSDAVDDTASVRRYSTVRWYGDKDLDEETGLPPIDEAATLEVALDVSRHSSVTSSNHSDSDDHDTDLDDVPDIINSFDAVVPDPNPEVGEVTYLNSCEELAAVPQSVVPESLATERLLVANRNLGVRDVTPLIRTLKLNTSLRELDLSGNAISYPGMIELSKVLMTNTTIKILNLSNNGLGILGAAAVAEMMQHNCGVKTLDISHNNLNDEAAKFLAIGVEVTETIENLDISNNEIGEQGGLHLGVGMQKNESIRRLNISWNCLRIHGAVKLIQGLQDNMMTTHVDVSYNGFGYEGALAVQRLLVASIYIVDLDLTANRLDWRCALLLAKGIANNSNLEILRVGKNPITTTGAMDLIDAVSSATCGLRFLDLTDVPVVREFLMIAQTIQEMRDFSFTHGGVVNSHDFLGRRNEKKIDPMKKLKDFMGAWGIRPNELFRIVNKNQSVTMSPEEFLRSLRRAGVPVSDVELEDILQKVQREKELEKDGISYKELLGGIRTHEFQERRTKMRERDQKILLNQYHERILKPALPVIYDQSAAHDKDVLEVDKKFKYLLLEQSYNAGLPPIDLNASYTSAGGGGGSDGGGGGTGDAEQIDLLTSINSARNLSFGGPKKHPTKVMSMTRPIGAKTKGFGENFKNFKKKKTHLKKSIKKINK